MKRFYAIALVLLTTGLLSGCGGGGDSTPPASTLSGKAAVGSPIVNGTVQIKCASGNPITTSTDSNGAYTATLSGQTLPCAVKVSGGNIGSATGPANATSYHSIATAPGTVNISPLTDLMVANLAQQDPGTWFAGLNGATLSPVTTAQVDTALTNLRAALTGLPLNTINPITTSFTAISGNVSDDMLAALGTATAAPGSYATLLGAAGTSSFTSTLNTALTTAYAGTTSGSTGGGAPTITSFTPSSGAGGTSVTITGTNLSSVTEVLFTGPAPSTAFASGVITAKTATSITATAPTSLAAGSYTISVTQPGVEVAAVGAFTVTKAGTGTNANSSCSTNDLPFSPTVLAVCLEYTGSYWDTPTNLTSAQNACGSPSVFASATSCPTSNRVGGCTVIVVATADVVYTYYSPKYDAASAQSVCAASHGTWVP